ncbi:MULTISPECIES: hypothetical protein [Moorena]|uniref:hypothetical protein n=1 Tax=Moorena TaxID=1155738 RepID=UPI0012B5191B|nr:MULTISPECIES: hypothetical protein [Moorena]NER87573.1 hypothetical protein [Moorena sp. SIO3A2]
MGRQRGLGGSPHERLPWFPPLAIASRQGATLNLTSDAEVRPVANLIRQRKAHHYGLGEAARSWGFPP